MDRMTNVSPVPVVSRLMICSSMCWIFIRTSKK